MILLSAKGVTNMTYTNKYMHIARSKSCSSQCHRSGKVIFITLAFLFLVTILFIVALSIFLPSLHDTDHYFNSVRELERLSEKYQSPADHHKKFLNKLNEVSTTLDDLANSMRGNQALPDVSKKMEVASQSLQDIIITLSPLSAHNEYDIAIKAVINESKELEELIKDLPFVSGEVITQATLKFLWIGLFTCLLVYLFTSPAVIRIISFMLSIFRSFKGFGFELTFADDDKKNKEIHTTFRDIFSELRHKAKDELSRFNQTSGLNDDFRGAADKILKHIREVTRAC